MDKISFVTFSFGKSLKALFMVRLIKQNKTTNHQSNPFLYTPVDKRIGSHLSDQCIVQLYRVMIDIRWYLKQIWIITYIFICYSYS